MSRSRVKAERRGGVGRADGPGGGVARRFRGDGSGSGPALAGRSLRGAIPAGRGFGALYGGAGLAGALPGSAGVFGAAGVSRSSGSSGGGTKVPAAIAAASWASCLRVSLSQMPSSIAASGATSHEQPCASGRSSGANRSFTVGGVEVLMTGTR